MKWLIPHNYPIYPPYITLEPSENVSIKSGLHYVENYNKIKVPSLDRFVHVDRNNNSLFNVENEIVSFFQADPPLV